MRYLITLITVAISCQVLSAQIELQEIPLERNTVIQKQHHQQEQAKVDRLARLFGSETPLATARNGSSDCEDDGQYEDGENVYVLSGETIEFCLDTIGFITFTNLSVDGNHGNVTVDSSCFTYVSNPGIELGLQDTIRVELCITEDNCLIREFPVVVKRENQSFIEPSTVLSIEESATICVSPANFDIPDDIGGSCVLINHNTNWINVENGVKRDSCIFVTANRFAAIDTIALEVCNNFCICDTFNFPYQIIADTLDLPFLDDFSYNGPYPNQLWLDKEVYVNNTWAHRPPSVGIATFDGLAPSGTPYGIGYGRCDELTSAYLDLSPYNSSSNVYLSCYVEPKGYGYHPNIDVGDSLVLEFKTSQGDWNQVASFQGLGNGVTLDSLNDFSFFSIKIENNAYFYSGFQFRFANYGQRAGIRDVWHVDYVRLAANEVPDGTFEDIAFTVPPNFLLQPYSSMPWKHVMGNEGNLVRDQFDIGLYSQFEVVETAEPSQFVLRELVNDAEILTTSTLLEVPPTAPVNQRNVPPAEHRLYTNPFSIPDFPSLAGDSLVFELEYRFTVDGQNPGLFPEVARNDTVRSRTYCTNYFAYDDGTAEAAIQVGFGESWRIAQEYEAQVEDTLRGVQIHFPHFSGNDNNNTNASYSLQIFIGDLDTEPVYEQFLISPFYPDELYDTLQAFTSLRLIDDNNNPLPIIVPAGKFYVSIEQVSNSSSPVFVGLDRNTLEAIPAQFTFDGAEWFPVANRGAMMMRPVFGSFFPQTSATEEVDEWSAQITVYPNPARDILYFDLGKVNSEDLQLSLFNAQGQLIQQQALNTNQLHTDHLTEGMYLLRFDNLREQYSETHKVFILRSN